MTAETIQYGIVIYAADAFRLSQFHEAVAGLERARGGKGYERLCGLGVEVVLLQIAENIAHSPIMPPPVKSELW